MNNSDKIDAVLKASADIKRIDRLVKILKEAKVEMQFALNGDVTVSINDKNTDGIPVELHDFYDMHIDLVVALEDQIKKLETKKEVILENAPKL